MPSNPTRYDPPQDVSLPELESAPSSKVRLTLAAALPNLDSFTAGDVSVTRHGVEVDAEKADAIVEAAGRVGVAIHRENIEEK